ncbi:transcription initiation factor TFIID 23-30kDa subunit-domain-containing protein [Aspergillus heterothallicus]
MSEPPSSLPPASQPLPSSSAEPPQTSSEATVVPKLEPETSDPSALDASADMANNSTTAANAEAGAVAAGPGDAGAPVGNPVQQTVVSVDAAASSKKETSLREFLGKMDEYAPIIPDAVTSHYLTLAGLPPPGNGPNQTPPHLARLLALATQKFIADIAADSYQYARIRASNSSSASNPMGSLNAASGLGVPGAGGAGGAAGGGGSGDAGKAGGGSGNKGGAHLGIQRAGFGGGGSGGSGQGRTVLTMEDLGMAVSEYGVSVKRGEFYR